MSLRTFQRFKVAPKPLGKEQSGQAWKFAEILAKATAVLGSQEAAEQWLNACGTDQRRPIDLLATPAGVKLVEDFLVRLEYRRLQLRRRFPRPSAGRTGGVAVGRSEIPHELG